jgi:site-specific DNA recombinase
MKNQENKNKYILYVRKSSEAEDKQIQSIPDQIRELEALAARLGLEVIDTYDEARSAKAPGRPKFTEMVERISRGDANGIIAWKLNRLARNPVDGGTISWMLQQGVIQHIQTYERGYYPTDNALLMAVELGIANQYLRDLSTDTKRGIRTRENEKGYPNGVAPMGYLNDMAKEPGDRGWLVDQARFELVKQLLCHFESGQFSIRQIVRIANDEMGLRTPVHKKQGGKKLVLSYVAGVLLRNPVYAGFFFVKDGTRRELNKEIPRAISEEQYWHNQKILRSKGRPRPSINQDLFPYKSVSVCGGCPGTVIAENKFQLICSECKKKFAYPKKTHCPSCGIAIEKMEKPKYLFYTFYHCNKNSHQPKCIEGSVEEKGIDTYLAAHFKEKLAISEELAGWCVRNLDLLEVSDKKDEYEKKESLQKTLEKKMNEDRELTLMRARSLLTDEDMLRARVPLKAEIETLQQGLAALGSVDPKKLEKARRAFNLAVGIEKVFENGSPQAKKEALMETGSNLTLKDKKPSVEHADLYSAIINGLLTAKAENPAFEPRNSEADKDETDTFVSVRPTLLPG